MNYKIESFRASEVNFHIQVTWTYDGTRESVWFGREDNGEDYNYFIKQASEDVLVGQLVGAEQFAKMFLSQLQRWEEGK